MKQLKRVACTLLMLLVLSCASTAIMSCITDPITAEAAKIKINKKKLTLNKGKSYQLKVTGTKKKVTWKSSKPSIVKVNNKGLVTAKKAGTAKITAKVNGKKYICTVTVKVKKTNKPNKPTTQQTKQEEKFSASTTNLTINQSGSVSITYTGDGSIYYSIKDDNICSCSWSKEWTNDMTTLYITGKKSGATVVTITNSTNAKKISITVNVDLYAQSVTIDHTEETLYVGDYITLKTTVSPSYAGQSVEWSSSDENIATVSSYGFVTAKSEGEAIITAKSKDGKCSAQCTITVKRKYVESINLSSTSETIYVGDSFSLSAEVYPSDAGDKSIEWSSSDENIATVSLYGSIVSITGKTQGQATITAKSKDGHSSAQCIVTVENIMNIELPSIPLKIYNFTYDGKIDTLCTVNNIYYKSEATIIGKLHYKVYIDGEKTYDRSNKNLSRACKIGYKLYKGEAVIDSGTFYSESVKVGEKFIGGYFEAYLEATPGNYRLELLNVQ